MSASNDPGGGSGGDSASSHPDINSMQQNFHQQQAKITALKELVRQSESLQGKKTASAQERVRNIAQRLTNIKTKATKSRQSRENSEVQDDTSSIYSQSILEENEDSSSNIVEFSAPDVQSLTSVPSTPTTRTRSGTPSTDKLNLLRQQIEQNRAKMVEREQSQRGIEELVTQLKSKFETSQMTLEKSVELGRSMSDLSFARDFNKSELNISTSSAVAVDSEHIRSLENRIKELMQEVANRDNLGDINLHVEKIQQLESKILDLEENLKEKESIIEARTQAVGLLTENLSMKGKNTVDLLEETKQEMFKMQTNFVNAETNLKEELERYQIELNEKNSKISNLEEVNDILETARYDLTVENADLKSKLEGVQEYSTKISELNKLNQSLMNRISDLENQKYEFITDEEVASAKIATFDESNKYSELMEKIKSLESQLAEAATQVKESAITETDNPSAIQELRSLLESQGVELANCQERLIEKTVEYDVLNVNFMVLQEKLESSGPKTLFSRTAVNDESELEILKLKKQLDEANKSQIKTKLKIKQMQKQIDTFKKSSNVHQEVGKLTEEVLSLTQKVAELEEEKGNLQLHLVNYDGSLPTSEMANKIKVLETTCLNQTTAIQLLEEQKADLSDTLNSSKSKLAMFESEISEPPIVQEPENILSVSTEMVSIELEEKIEKLEKQVEQLTTQNEALRTELAQLSDEKKELQMRLDNYVSENFELLDKIEKLSIEKVSSAESIEIVDNLTQQEKMEIEEYHKSFDKTDEGSAGEGAIGDELNDSLIKLREESSELMEKIELFTTERREVMEKLDALNLENQKYIKEIEALKSQTQEVTEERETMQGLLNDALAEKETLMKSIKEINDNRMKSSQTSDTLSSSTESSPVKSSATAASANVSEFEAYEKALTSLDSEIQNFNKIKDKNVKARTKKLTSEAKNLHTMMSSLLTEYTAIKTECNELRSEMENYRIQVNCLSLGDTTSSNEIQRLKTLLETATTNQREKSGELEEVRRVMEEKVSELKKLKDVSTDADDKIAMLQRDNDRLTQELSESSELRASSLSQLRHELEASLQTAHNEIEILKTLAAEQKDQLIEAYQENEHIVTEKTKAQHDYENQIKKFEMELTELRQANNKTNQQFEHNIRDEIEKLNRIIQENNQLIDEQRADLANKQESIDVLNNQMTEIYRTMEENVNKLLAKDDEIQHMEEMLDEKSLEVKMLNEKYTSNCSQLQDYLSEISALQKQVNSAAFTDDEKAALELRINDLLTINTDLENKNKEQLEKLKKFAANFKKKSAQCTELEEKLKQTADIQDRLASANAQCEDLARRLKQSEDSERKLQQSYDDLEQEFNQSVREKDEAISGLQLKFKNIEQQLNEIVQQKNAIIAELQQKQGAVEQKLQLSEEKINQMQFENSKLNVSLQQTASKENEMLTLFDDISFLENKNLELKADIKKLEDRLAEKSKGYEELQQMMDVQQKMSAERATQMQKTEEDLKAQNIKIEKCKAVIKEKNKEIQKLRAQVASVEQSNEATGRIEELSQQVADLQQTNKQMFEENQKKMELENSLELCEIENSKLKDKISKMEEGLSYIEQRRSSLERQKQVLDSELKEKTSEFVQNEDMLLKRLNALTEHDMIIENNLIEVEKTNTELQEKVCELQSENQHLKQSIQNLESSTNAMQKNSERVYDLENENSKYAHQVVVLQNEIKKIAMDYERNLAAKHAEIDELESELSSQLQKIEAEKKSVQEALEKSREENAELQDEVVRVKDNIHMLEQIKTDFEREITWTKLQNETLSQENLEIQEIRMQFAQEQNELKEENESLRQQIYDMDSMRSQLSQNQTDDQVLLQNETKKLKEMLEERDALVLQYQQRLMQMQMSQTFAATPNDPFAMLAAPTAAPAPAASPVPVQIQTDEDEVTRQLEEKVNQLTQEVQSLKSQMDAKEQRNQELVLKMDELQLKCDDFHRQVIEFERVLVSKNTELVKLTEEVSNLKLVESTVAQQNTEMSQQIQTLTTSSGQVQSLLEEKIAAIEKLERQLRDQQEQQSQPLHESATKSQSIPKQSSEDIPAFSTAMFFSSPGGFDDFMNVAQPPQTPVVEEMCVVKKVERVASDVHESQAAEIEQLRAELAVVRGSCDEVMQKLAESTRSLNECNELLLNYQQQILILQSENEQLKGKLDKSAENYQQQIVNLQAENEDLKNRIEANAAQNYQQQNFNLQSENNELKNTLEMNSAQNYQLQSENNELKSKLNVSSEQNYQQQILNLQSENNELMNRLEMNAAQNYQQQILNLQSENNELKSKIEKTSEQNYQRQILNFETEYDELKDKIDKSNAEKAAVAQKAEAASLSSFFDNTPAASVFSQPMSLQVVTDSFDYAGMQPVSEEVIVPKKQYLCHPAESAATSGLTDFDDSLDGWGADEALLEAQHQQLTTTAPQSLISPNTLMKANLREHEDRINQLEAEKKSLQEDVTNQQSKLAKLLKKLKEYKLKNDELLARSYKKSPSVETSSELDLAIQEELNAQLKALQAKFNETKTEGDKDRLEKESLLKRVDVLSSANDRMTEMKERQDRQVEMLHMRVKELTEKLRQMEDWGDDNGNAPAVDTVAAPPSAQTNAVTQALQQKVQELQKEVEDLRVDNDELQALLEEEKSNTKMYEEKIRHLQSLKTTGEDDHQAQLDKLESLLKDAENSRDALRSHLETKDAEIHELISKIDMFSMESAKIKSSLEQMSVEHKEKTNENQALSQELQQLMNKNASMSEELGRMQSATNLFQDAESLTAQIHDYEEKFQSLNAELQYKNSEIMHLNQKIQQVLDEDQTQILVNEILEKNNEMNKLRSLVNKLENEKVELENNLSIQLTSDMSALKNDEATQMTKQLAELKGQLDEMTRASREWNEEKAQMEHELQTLNDQVLTSFALEDRMKQTILELDTKNIEIAELKSSLQQYQQGQQTTTAASGGSAEIEELRSQFQAEKAELERQYQQSLEQTNAQWGQLVDQRGNDVAESWKQHLQQREAEFADIQSELQRQIQQQQTSDASASGAQAATLGQGDIPNKGEAEENAGGPITTMPDYAKIQEALESQELEIVTLKEQLAIRSAEYARLAARVDPFGQMSSSSMITMAPRRSGDNFESEKVPRNELDLALYMLHQRDMRCEELTFELMNLLEERDTLQLKLSNSLRQNEENKLKSTTIATDASDSTDGSKTTTPEKQQQQSHADVVAGRPTTPGNTTAENLDTKISQLHAVGHSRDKTILDDVEGRYKQMSLIQRDLANMPKAAAAKIVGANETQSELSSQSASTVLMNWFLGKSSDT